MGEVTLMDRSASLRWTKPLGSKAHSSLEGGLVPALPTATTVKQLKFTWS
jgi:hypothetical protein